LNAWIFPKFLHSGFQSSERRRSRCLQRFQRRRLRAKGLGRIAIRQVLFLGRYRGGNRLCLWLVFHALGQPLHPSALAPERRDRAGLQTRIVVSDSSTMLRAAGQSGNHPSISICGPISRKMIPPHLGANFSRLVHYISIRSSPRLRIYCVIRVSRNLPGPLDTQIVLPRRVISDRRDLELGNYVFVGSPTSNPWVFACSQASSISRKWKPA